MPKESPSYEVKNIQGAKKKSIQVKGTFELWKFELFFIRVY